MNAPFEWKHIDYSNPEDVAWIRGQQKIDPLVAEAMIDEETRPRTVHAGEGILLILRGVNLNTGSDIEDMVSVRIWFDHNSVITSSRRSVRSLDDLRAGFERGDGPRSPGRFVLQLVSRLSDYIGEAIEEIETRLEQAEAMVNDADSILKNSPFSVVRRQTARIRRYLAPQREALQNLLKVTGTAIPESLAGELREQSNRLTLILEDLDLIRERALVAQEEFLGILAHEQNSRMLLLSIVAAIFLPLSFLTGLMGMNVAGLPGLENPWAFAIVSVIMVVVALFILLGFRFKKWL